MKTQLDTHVHRFPSADNRHWSSPELADLADGKITEQQCSERRRARLHAEGIDIKLMVGRRPNPQR